MKVIEHECADGRRKIALAALINFDDQIGELQLTRYRDLLETVPERVLEADAGSVPGDDDRSFDDWRFHERLSIEE